MKFFTEVEYTRGTEMRERLVRALAEYKVVHLQGVPHEGGLDTFYHHLAESMGNFLFKNENPVTADLDSEGWIDMRYDQAMATNHAYRHGNGRMPLHMDGVYTDVKFDIILLFSAEAAKWGGATTFIDGETIIEFLEDYDADLLSRLRSTPVLTSKGNKSKFWPIIFEEDGMPAFNWNMPRVDKTNSEEVWDICRAFDEFCEKRLVDGGLMTNCSLQKGEAVFFHNRLVLHGRNSFYGDRCLMKGAIALPVLNGSVLPALRSLSNNDFIPTEEIATA
jgi:alpha-ketoglutarate-dependent taurine dioxygenase